MRNVANKKLPWQIEMTALDTLKPDARNARTHSRKQVQQIADSIKKFGTIAPLVVDESGTIVAGHGRYAAAQLLKIKHFPAIRISNLSEAEFRAYRIADNKIAQNAGWDREILALELRDLQIELPDFDLTLDVLGFEPDEVDLILADHIDDQPDPNDEIPNANKVVTLQTGDLFTLGHHRLLVGEPVRIGLSKT